MKVILMCPEVVSVKIACQDFVTVSSDTQLSVPRLLEANCMICIKSLVGFVIEYIYFFPTLYCLL